MSHSFTIEMELRKDSQEVERIILLTVQTTEFSSGVISVSFFFLPRERVETPPMDSIRGQQQSYLPSRIWT